MTVGRPGFLLSMEHQPMRRILPLVALAAAALAAACKDAGQLVAPPEPSASRSARSGFSLQQQPEGVVPGAVLARLSDGVDPATVGAANGLRLDRVTRGYVMFRGAAGNERALAARLRGDGRVVWAEPDYLRQTSTIDPRLWAFHNPGGLTIDFTRGPSKGQPVSSYLSTDDADEDNVEAYAAGGSPVSIASIDTGVDFTHPEFLPGQLVAGWDYYDNDADPTDTEGHGTHTTGTMVGRNVGVAGVAGAGPNVTVYVYRVCGQIGCPTSAIVSAIYAATDAGVVAMNMSLGGSSESSAEADAIAYATSHNALVIASAGNDGTSTVSCPACDPAAISVAASNWQDGLSYYSNWGSGLDITAPGGEMYSNTTEESGIYSSVPGGYAYYQGTSMAAPQVTGTAAIVASVDGLSGSALRSRILGTTDDLGAPGYDTQFGNGRLNSYRAVTNSTLNEGGSPPASLTAAFSYSCSGLDCSFDGSSSTGAASWSWLFGDSGSGSGETTSHTYAGVGNYTVTLTVADDHGDTNKTSKTVQCKQRGKSVRCN
jgi:serine protease